MKSIALKQWEAAAYAAGRLTQLRRVCKPQPKYGASWITCNGIQQDWLLRDRHGDDMDAPFNPPYGAPGDTLALRETWAYLTYGDIEDAHYVYRADYKPGTRIYEYPCGCGFCHEDPECARWKSSTSMPLSAVRHHPVITAVRLERVQEMSEADARACGARREHDEPDWSPFCDDGYFPESSYVIGYMHQFDRDNPRTPWDSNPWTWVYDVEGVKA